MSWNNTNDSIKQMKDSFKPGNGNGLMVLVFPFVFVLSIFMDLKEAYGPKL